MCLFNSGSLSEASGVRPAGPALGDFAADGGGCPVRLYRLCFRSLHKTTETSGQLSGQYDWHNTLLEQNLEQGYYQDWIN